MQCRESYLVCLPNINSLIVNPDDATQAVNVVEGRPVPGEDVRADTVDRGVSCFQQSQIVPLLPHNLLGLLVSELGDYATPTHAGAKG